MAPVAMRAKAGFGERYGPWALVAGASEGLGAAFAQALARRGVNVALAARRRELLDALAKECRSRFGVETRVLAGDLGDPRFAEEARLAIADLELGLVVYNAAFAPIGGFADAAPADLSRVVDVNARGPVLLLRALLPAMIARGRGGVVLMSSLAGNQGAPRIAAYAASKAFNRVLAEGLWSELKPLGIDVVACCAGAIRTPSYSMSSAREAPGTASPDFVAEFSLRSLGRGPVAIPGLVNQIAAWTLGRLLPRRAAIGIMDGSTKSLSNSGKAGPAS
jgi:short-subunit dehydrogenase